MKSKHKITQSGKAKPVAKAKVKVPAKQTNKGTIKAQAKDGTKIQAKLEKSKAKEKLSAKAAGIKPKKDDSDARNLKLKQKSPDSKPEGDAAQKSKANKNAKANPKAKQKKTDEFEDVLLTDDEVGSEELPDLSEFDELEEEPEVVVEEADSAETVEVKSADDEIVLTDAEGRRLCRVRDCDQAASVEGYCRFHYLYLWKKIQIRRKILSDGKLERYVEDLTSRYPDKFLEMLRKDLRSEKDFLSAIAEMEIDESALEAEYEEDQTYIEEVRGVSSESPIADDEEF